MILSMHQYPMLRLLPLLALVLFACESSPEPAETSEPQPILSSRISLTDQQRELAGIVDGPAEKRLMANDILATGAVEAPPHSLTSVYAPIAGFVRELPHLLPGDYVRQGTTLCRLSHPDFARRQRELLEIHSQLAFLEKEQGRKQTLAEGDATSQRALEQAQAELDLAMARYKGIKAELSLMGFAVDDILEKGEVQTQLVLRAPASGYLVEVNVNPGKLVHPDEALFTFIDQGHLHLEVDVFAKDLPAIRQNQRIHCWVPGGGPEDFIAEVHQIGKVIDPETRTARIHGHFNQEPVSLNAGTYVQVRIETGPDTVVAVPYTAIAREGQNAFIFVKSEQGYQKAPVTLGREEGDYVELIGYEGTGIIALSGAYYLNGAEAEE